ncbi:MAG: hypothetical protein BWY57_00767 [Betaproteobacteria bacterium ADurb.Bin341]|nr:MAG: hypothetical protein BWY57_00767 [Betaproteobacteria bacterium ADurb.Bin341]
MRKEHLAHRVCQKLDRTLDDLSPRVLRRLEAGRRHALAHQKRQAGLWGLAMPGIGPVSFELSGGVNFRRLLAMLLVLTALVFAFYWQGHQYVHDLEDIDSALLADDIPPDAFLDQGFAAWLEDSSD